MIQAYAVSKAKGRFAHICFGRTATAVLLLLITIPVAAVVNTGTDEESRLPDQTRGFFQARGFSVEDSELIAQGCVFQTVFKNISASSEPSTIEYNLRDWVVRAAGARRGLKTREDWQKEWSARKAPQPAQLAFEWSLLPTRQTYRPGDYNWGMMLFGLKPGTGFDLDVVWHQDGKQRTARLKAVRCAADVHLKPGDL